jgi:hypothetical protein
LSGLSNVGGARGACDDDQANDRQQCKKLLSHQPVGNCQYRRRSNQYDEKVEAY